MIQFMTPIDFWRTGIALWKRSAELQVEMMRMSVGMAGGMAAPATVMMQMFHPPGLSATAKGTTKAAPEVKSTAPSAGRAPARKSRRTAPKPVKLAVVESPAKPAGQTAQPKVAPKAAAKKTTRKAAPIAKATPKPAADAKAEAPKPATRRRAPSKPKTPDALLETVKPVDAAPAKSPRTGRKSATKPAAKASAEAPKETARRRRATASAKKDDA